MAVIIEPWRVPAEGRRLVGEEPAAALDLDPDGEARPEGPVHYDLTALYVSEKLIVSGDVSARVGFLCSRCGERFVATVRQPAFDSVVDVPDPHVCVDLTGEIRESIILNFPTYPLCQPACRGLCPRCGVNLNKADCRCRKQADEHWGAFDAL